MRLPASYGYDQDDGEEQKDADAEPDEELKGRSVRDFLSCSSLSVHMPWYGHRTP